MAGLVDAAQPRCPMDGAAPSADFAPRPAAVGPRPPGGGPAARLLATSGGAPQLQIVADTAEYRRCASELVFEDDHVVEVGSCLGHCTAILHKRAASVLGIDVSQTYLASCRERLPSLRFEFLDIFEEAGRLRGMTEAQRCTVAFVDVGGNRELSQVLRAVDVTVHAMLRLRLLVVKSQQLHEVAAEIAAASAWGGSSPGLTWEALGWEAGRLEASKPYGRCSQKKKAARCIRLAAPAAPSTATAPPALVAPAASASPGVVPCRRDVERSLPPGAQVRSGFWYVRVGGCLQAAAALVTTEHNQPLLRRCSVMCAYEGAAAALELAAAAAHPVPVFLGSGGSCAPCEHVGSFRAVGVLARDDPLYQDHELLHVLQSLAMRSRRPVAEVQLLEVWQVDEMALPLPRHPLEAQGPAEWARVVCQRALAVLCLSHWRRGCASSQSRLSAPGEVAAP